MSTPNHKTNWQVRYSVTEPTGARTVGVVFARTRKDARGKVVELHRDAPFGVLVRHAAPRKVPIV
jgi:hypothetical protein